MFKCKKCSKKISGRGKSMLCQSCVKKELYKHHPEKNPMLGKHHSKNTKKLISEANLKKGLPNCLDCKKSLNQYHHNRCWKCWSKVRFGVKHSLKTKQKMRITAIKRFSNPENHPMFGLKRPDQSKRMKGKNNPNFIVGISEVGYPYYFNSIKESIRTRDRHICKLCRKKQRNLTGYHKKLSIHHIDYNKKNCKQTNLITLCIKCNVKVNYNRDYWYAYFTYIMKTK